MNRGRVTNTKNGLSIIEKIKEMKGDRVKDRLEREVKKKKSRDNIEEKPVMEELCNMNPLLSKCKRN